MYLNVKYLQESGLGLKDFANLLVIKQNQGDTLKEFIDSNMSLEELETLGGKELVNFVKSGGARLSTKGTKFLESVTTPDITVGDEKMAEYLMEMYLGVDENRVIGNKKNVVMYTAQFRQVCNLSLHQMYWLCDLFISETKYTLKLENIFFDANKHRYGRFLNHLEDSKLYQFYDEKKEMVKDYWAQKIK